MEEKKKTKQNGISLIALIITIIVILILVVIINVVLNRRLFTQAQTETSDTQKESDREQPSGGTGDEDEVTDENLGKYVTYKGITWIVLYNDKNKVELISADALGSATLGGSSFDEGSFFNEAKDSYNNVIAILTQTCKDVTGIETGIRNVGGPAEAPTDLGTVTLAKLKSEGFEPQSNKETIIEELISDIKQGDNNYLEDYNQMEKLGIAKTENSCSYWLASRLVSVYSFRVLFRARYVSSDGNLYDDYLCYVSRDGYHYGYNSSKTVRPVVSLNSGILDGKSGTGTKSDPIKLD